MAFTGVKDSAGRNITETRAKEIGPLSLMSAFNSEWYAEWRESARLAFGRAEQRLSALRLSALRGWSDCMRVRDLL